MIAGLLWAFPGLTSLDELQGDLGVSKTSARRDLQLCEPWLERNGLPVLRRPGRGVGVVGSERRIRQVMVQLLLEALPRVCSKPTFAATLASPRHSPAVCLSGCASASTFFRLVPLRRWCGPVP